MVFAFGFSAEKFSEGHGKTVGDQVGKAKYQHHPGLKGCARYTRDHGKRSDDAVESAVDYTL